jgi:hypothetical protein
MAGTTLQMILILLTWPVRSQSKRNFHLTPPTLLDMHLSIPGMGLIVQVAQGVKQASSTDILRGPAGGRERSSTPGAVIWTDYILDYIMTETHERTRMHSRKYRDSI